MTNIEYRPSNRCKWQSSGRTVEQLPPVGTVGFLAACDTLRRDIAANLYGSRRMVKQWHDIQLRIAPDAGTS